MSRESDSIDFTLMETELTLGLPGVKTGTKRGFFDTIDFHLATPTHVSANSGNNFLCSVTKSQPPKEEMVGWPPVRCSRKNGMKKCKYVKVAMDGAPYLRKLDLQMYHSYHHLLTALLTMFSSLTTIRNHLNERKLMDKGKGIEYMATYEDKDGDRMLLGDVPWEMFVESCKRIRLMISSETIGLGPMSASKCKGNPVRRINGAMIRC